MYHMRHDAQRIWYASRQSYTNDENFTNFTIAKEFHYRQGGLGIYFAQHNQSYFSISGPKSERVAESTLNLSEQHTYVEDVSMPSINATVETTYKAGAHERRRSYDRRVLLGR